MERHRYIVSLDYGTTFTGKLYSSLHNLERPTANKWFLGAAYVSSTKKTIDDVNVISNWPGQGEVAVKTPSKISY